MERIVVTVSDEGMEALGALARGISLARRIGARLYVLSLERPGSRAAGASSRLFSVGDEVAERMQMLIEGARADGVSVDIHISEGSYEEALVRFCREYRVTLWIVGIPDKHRRDHHEALMRIHKIRARLGCAVEIVHPKRTMGPTEED
ncbi:Universal stress protein family protein [Desulfacinum hydrothermale DSM 13146]|uniref:Universal stress protein family protein n=1 Tax=Desulfacinum hydrothermale DSM 13146 TaxID=1121390 RepID=A0A1W1WXQ5_9BACT|nr:universal stress protein [Desulfacinum hydrothermale]SMC16509.1 Universal stress protein family protein [Desulfacinum hydrothermale DSM 13146]